jgi:hypothetical protein
MLDQARALFSPLGRHGSLLLCERAQRLTVQETARGEVQQAQTTLADALSSRLGFLPLQLLQQQLKLLESNCACNLLAKICFSRMAHPQVCLQEYGSTRRLTLYKAL